MNINIIRRIDKMTFAELERKDVFYLVEEDEDDDTTHLYMVIDPVEYEDCYGEYASYNCVCLDTGFLTYKEPDERVRICNATINVEG